MVDSTSDDDVRVMLLQRLLRDECLKVFLAEFVALREKKVCFRNRSIIDCEKHEQGEIGQRIASIIYLAVARSGNRRLLQAQD
jgi:hypothetical protein